MQQPDIQVIRESIGKIVSMLTSRRIKVTQRGVKAYVAYNKKTGAIEMVNVPYLPDNATPDFIAAVQGFLDHEVGHVLFTDQKVVIKSHTMGKRIANLANIMEDVFVERKMGEAFQGSNHNLESVRKFFLEKISRPKITEALAAGDMDKALGYAIVPAFRAWGGQTTAQDFIKEPTIAKLVEPLRAKIGDDLIKELNRCKNSQDCLNLAVKVKEALTPPPPPPAPPPPPPPPAIPTPPPPPPPSDDDEEQEDPPEDPPEDDEQDPGDDGQGDDADPQDQDDDSTDDATPPTPGDDDQDPADPPEDDTGPAPADPGDDGYEDALNATDPEPEDDAASDPADPPEDDDSAPPEDAAGGGAGDEDAGDPAPGDEGEEGEGEEDPDADDLESGGMEEEEEAQQSQGGTNDPHAGQGGSDEDGAAIEKDTERDLGELFEEQRDFDSEVSEGLTRSAEHQLNGADYKIYSTEWDRVETARPSQDPECIAALEAGTEGTLGVMQKQLERAIAAQARKAWNPAQRRGRISPGSLFKSAVGDDRLFRQRFETKAKNTAVELLVDCSGSMVYGGNLAIAARAAYALSSVLERIKIQHEIMGYTTYESKEMELAMEADSTGSVTADDYARDEAIYMPVFKHFHERLTSDVKSRLGALVNTGGNFCRCNIDGESLQIAAHRLKAQRAERHVLIALSDGDPNCTPGGYAGINQLRSHMRKAVKDAEARGIEVIGIGIQTNSVQTYYGKSVVLSNLAELPTTVMAQLTKILLAGA